MQATTSDYSTKDLHLAAFLLSTDHPLRRLNGPPGQRAFIFGSVTEEVVTGFYSGAKVDARKLLNAVRDLKALLHQEGHR